MRVAWRLLEKREEIEEPRLDAELRFHFDALVAQNIQAGMSDSEARRQARIEFGGIEQVKEECRDARGFAWLTSAWQDLRFAVRMLGKSKSLTAILVLTLALGIGANTAIFGVLNGWLLRPLPVKAPEQLTVLASHRKDTRNAQFSYADLEDFRKQADVFSDLFAFGFVIAGMSADGTASEFAYSGVTGNYFSALGVKPVLGRLFLPGEGEKEGEEFLAVLGYGYWQKRFGGDRQIVGKQVRVNGKSVRIIGVTLPEFHGTLFGLDMDGYLTLSALQRNEDPDGGFWTERRGRHLSVLGRLKSGIRMRQAQSSVDVIAARLAVQYPDADKDVSVRVIPEKLARPVPMVASFVPVIATLFLALPALLLLLACLSVTNILLARAVERQREMAIRASVGGGRGRLIRHMLTESLVVAVLGGSAGVLLGEWATRSIGAALHPVITSSSNYSFALDPSFDLRGFFYALGAALFAGVFVGIWPALQASRVDLNTLLHDGGFTPVDKGGVFPHHQRVRKALVVMQVAGSLVLLIVSALFVRSLKRAESMDIGFNPDHVLNAIIDPREIGYDETQTKTFYRELEDRLRSKPGIQSTSLALTVPFTYASDSRPIHIEGRPDAFAQQPPAIFCNLVEPSYFETMRVPLLRGRGFTEHDDETGRPVAIVNQTMAKRFWPNEDAIGKRFSFKGPGGPFVEVVGLAQNGQYMFLTPDAQAYFYLPLAQNFIFYRSLQVRSALPPQSLIGGVEAEIHQLAPDLPIIDIRTMPQMVQGLAGFFLLRLAASLAATLGLLGLILAVLGIYGVVSFDASKRTREIGMRIALGANRGDILKLILTRGLRLVAIGIVVGLGGALLVSRAITRLLIGIAPNDPLTYGVVATLLGAVTLVACWIPARRATRINPSEALRCE